MKTIKILFNDLIKKTTHLSSFSQVINWSPTIWRLRLFFVVMTLRVLCRGGLFCWENIKLNQFSVERCFLGRSRDQLLQRKLKFIRSRALLTIIHLCRDFQAIGDSIYYSILMIQVFCSSQNDMIRSGTQKL